MHLCTRLCVCVCLGLACVDDVVLGQEEQGADQLDRHLPQRRHLSARRVRQ